MKKVLSVENFEKLTGIKISAHDGKLECIFSYSTNARNNTRCIARNKQNHGICKSCFAQNYIKSRANLRTVLDKNLVAFQEELEVLPNLSKYELFRFESFGDTMSATQAGNYLDIAAANPRTKFACFTKNLDHYAEAIANGHVKPENLVMIFSCFTINQQKPETLLKMVQRKFPFVDKIFTVVDDPTVKGINCNVAKCKDCKRCFEKNTGGNVCIELLKGESEMTSKGIDDFLKPYSDVLKAGKMSRSGLKKISTAYVKIGGEHKHMADFMEAIVKGSQAIETKNLYFSTKKGAATVPVKMNGKEIQYYNRNGKNFFAEA